MYKLQLSGVQCKDSCGSKPMGFHFGVGVPPIFEPILVVGLGCSLGYDLDFDPWPCILSQGDLDVLDMLLFTGDAENKFPGDINTHPG